MWVDFDVAEIGLDSFACLVLAIAIPAPPVDWDPVMLVQSYPVRQQHVHVSWLRAASTWISAAVAFACYKRQNGLLFDLPRHRGTPFLE